MNESSREHRFLSPALRKVLVTAATGVLTYYVTNLADAQPDFQLLLSVFLGGVVLVVQFLVDFDDRLERLEQEQHVYLGRISDLIDQGLDKISEATALFALVEASPVQTELVTQLIRHSTGIPRDTPQLIHDLTHTEISRLSLLLKNLSEGVELTYPGEDRDWLIALTGNAHSSIYATSMSGVDSGGKGFGGGFWYSDLGRRYLKIQRDACQRGVEIRRIFIVDPREPVDPAFEEMCNWQTSIGINVRTLQPNSDSITRQWRSWMQDFIVFDDVVSYEMQTAPRVGAEAHPTFIGTRLVLDPAQVKERREHFQDLWATAVPFVPPDRP
jgi:hypothetical protein